ncbi:MAG: polymerase [Mucilaginibacter polytrichastri]|nr:polymerase [Mucilaginibacter polytrichastri]
MKRWLLFSLLFFAGVPAMAQVPKFVPKFIRRMFLEKDTSRRPSFIPIPVISYAQETGFEFGGSGLYSFYSDTLDRKTRVSSIFGYATVTTKGQSRLSLSTSYWTPGNRYHYSAGVSYVNFPINFYGIGSDTRLADVDRYGQKRFRASVGGEKRFGDHIYIGAFAGGFNFDFSVKDSTGIFATAPGIEGRNGGGSLFFGPSFTFDNRNSVTYTRRGSYIAASYSFLQGIFSNNGYHGGQLVIDAAQFIPLSKKFTLGLNEYSASLFGNEHPFYFMPALGSDELMRGYYGGRYRDRNYVAAQTELRYRLSDRIGVVGFAGTGTVFKDEFSFKKLKPNYGGGLRYFFDVEKGLSLRLDYGFGEKRPGEVRQKGFYIGLGETF